jgi:hypothetical protein
MRVHHILQAREFVRVHIQYADRLVKPFHEMPQKRERFLPVNDRAFFLADLQTHEARFIARQFRPGCRVAVGHRVAFGHAIDQCPERISAFDRLNPLGSQPAGKRNRRQTQLATCLGTTVPERNINRFCNSRHETVTCHWSGLMASVFRLRSYTLGGYIGIFCKRSIKRLLGVSKPEL